MERDEEQLQGLETFVTRMMDELKADEVDPHDFKRFYDALLQKQSNYDLLVTARRLEKLPLPSTYKRFLHIRQRAFQALAEHPSLPPTYVKGLVEMVPAAVARNPAWTFHQVADATMRFRWIKASARLSSKTATLDAIVEETKQLPARYALEVWSHLVGNRHLSKDAWKRAKRFWMTRCRSVAILRAWAVIAPTVRSEAILRLPHVRRLRHRPQEEALSAVASLGGVPMEFARFSSITSAHEVMLRYQDLAPNLFFLLSETALPLDPKGQSPHNPLHFDPATTPAAEARYQALVTDKSWWEAQSKIFRTPWWSQ